MIYKAMVNLFIAAQDAQSADSAMQSTMAHMLATCADLVTDWSRAGTCYPVQATKAEVKAVEYFRDNPDMRQACR